MFSARASSIVKYTPEITTKLSKQIPEDVVDQICAFVPKIINKRTKLSTTPSINYLRHKKAYQLHCMLQEYYADDIDEYQKNKINHIFAPVNPEDVILSAHPKRLSRTLECISEILLSDHANWSRIFLTEWSLYELYLGRNNVYRSLNELAHFNKALKTNNYHYSVISTLSYRKRNDLLNLIV